MKGASPLHSLPATAGSFAAGGPPVRLLVLVSLIWTCAVIGAQEEAVNQSTRSTAVAIERHMRVLAHERMQGRRSGTAEYANAARYVADVMRSHGARPVIGTDLRVRFDASLTSTTHVALGLGSGETVTTTVPPDQLCVLPGAGEQLRRGALPLRELRDEAASLPHLSWSESGPLPGFTGVAGELSARFTEKRKVARAAGAVALLILLPDTVGSPEWRGRRDWCERGEIHPETAGRELPVIFLSREASTALKRTIDSTESVAQFQLTRVRRPHRGINVLGQFGAASTEAIVVTAHLDHLGVVVDGDGRRRVAPGAVDNASGVAALLELGRRLSASPALSRAVVLAATDAEEARLVGSTVLVEQLARAGMRVVANINIDGATLMQHPLVDLVALGGRDSDIGEIAEAAARDVGVEMSLEYTPIAGSDHFPFALAGVPAVWLVAGTKTNVDGLDGAELQARWMREVYHSPRDSVAQSLDYVAAARLVDVVDGLVRRLASREQAAPRWKPGALWGSRHR